MPTKSLERLILEFNKLPGVGQKSATRYAFHILNQSEEDVKNFAEALLAVKDNVKRCSICGNYCESDTCNICSDNTRNHNIICVVEESKDIMILEKTTKYRGVYHVLNGRLDPLNGITPNELNIKSLIERLGKEDIEEIILATNPNIEGETTAMYLAKLIKNFGIKITKLASGIPMGGNLEFSDTATISRALDDRVEI
ncbi:recombination mediator RecR [Fusobacterium pseudoperiodonticum]|jgi:recombination protein recR|uniref:Recombination protein RecR n=1 Tax=Fusobacterium pseudoperiodonticum TaxID=2663009 RepID=A0A2G9EJ20_9FUSO|nr:recombination mediator RecR [Fusobacterium pseudoperiodonticum]ATV60226.1 recombination protein RecR [Fusobacterium pseudoperiodonticum]PIM80910.1 recombination protein RecR [Fusobacterium pseudoperiodonticum]